MRYQFFSAIIRVDVPNSEEPYTAPELARWLRTGMLQLHFHIVVEEIHEDEAARIEEPD